jgi:hypothetical protein
MSLTTFLLLAALAAALGKLWRDANNRLIAVDEAELADRELVALAEAVEVIR